MEQEAEALSQWQAVEHQLEECLLSDLPTAVPTQDTETSMCILDTPVSPGSSGVHSSWNHDPTGAQYFPQCPQLESFPLVSSKAPGQNASEVGSQFSVLLPERGVNYFPQVTLTPSQMIYCHDMSSSGETENQEMIFKGPQMIPLGEPNIPQVAMSFSEHLRMPPSEPAASAPSKIPMMSQIRAPTVPYLGSPTASSNRDSLTPKMLLPPTMPSTESQAVLPSLAQMLPHRDPHNCGMSPAESPSLLALESQDALVSQPPSQEDPFLPEQHTPAPQRARQNSRTQERAPRRRPPVLRPYCCQYEDCRKAYTKRSHLVSHQRKHTGERPYKCKWDGCTWSFFRSDELGRHMRIHTRYRPHRCHQCSRQFMRSDHLRQHQRTHLRMPRSSNPWANNGQMAGPSAPGL